MADGYDMEGITEGATDLGLLDDDTYKRTVLRQKLLGIADAFLYKIPKEKATGEQYLAGEWNLKKPLHQCNLLVERRENILFIVFTYIKPGQKGNTLFAICCIDLINNPGVPMHHYVVPVADSSRYYVIRVQDQSGDREALLGLGFKNTDESLDFQACLATHVSDIQKEQASK